VNVKSLTFGAPFGGAINVGCFPSRPTVTIRKPFERWAALTVSAISCGLAVPDACGADATAATAATTTNSELRITASL